MFTTIVTALISVGGAFYGVLLIINALRHKDLLKAERGHWALLAPAEALTWFLASFGVSDTALHMLLFRVRNTVKMDMLPGTIIVCATVPLCVMSVAYLHTAQVDTLTCLLLIAAQASGAFLGAKYVVGLRMDRLRVIMAAALIGTALVILFKQFFSGMEGGNAMALPPALLAIAWVVFFVLGALTMVGLGPTTLNISMLLLFGMHPTAVFPIVMSANAIGCLVGCYPFVKSGRYHRKAALASLLFGVAGVLVAVHVVKGMNVALLQWMMVLVLLYSAYSILRPAKAV